MSEPQTDPFVEAPPAATPNEELAGMAARALAGSGLVPPGILPDLELKLAAGAATEEEWHFWVETALPAEARKDGDGRGD